MTAATETKSGPARYVTLDAMRGVAAIVVVMGHLGETLGTWSPHFFFIAVDLFFVLSGFVLALNYDHRFAAGMPALQFMRLRAIRLFPLAMIGAALGLCSQLVGDASPSAWAHATVSFLLTVLALPSPPPFTAVTLFPLNSVFWSLFLELWVANLVFALFWKPLHGRVLATLIALTALGLLWCERHYHGMNIGWGWTTLVGGFWRVGFSFFIGVAIARRHAARTSRFKPPSWLCLLVLATAFAAPISGQVAQLVSLAYILVLMPLAVSLGANASTGHPRVGAVLGDASYAVYAIHYPILVMVTTLVRPAIVGDGPAAPILFGLAFIAAVVALALILDRWFDRPLRRWLLAHMPSLARPASATSGLSR